MMTEKRPSVAILIGRVRKIRIGLTNVLIIPKTKEAIRSDVKLSMDTPGRSLAVTATAIVEMINRSNRFIAQVYTHLSSHTRYSRYHT